MAKISATPRTARRRRRANAVALLPNRPHRFLRLLAAIPKISRHRRGLVAASPFRPPLPISEKRRSAIKPQNPSPTRDNDVETTSHPEAEEPQDPDAEGEAVAGKYWAHRHSLFSLYDRGVRLDAEGWYSATPEAIAAAQAARAGPAGLVVDAFAGVGGNSIQFAARGCYVVAVEIDPRKVELARHNARIYGVEDRIEFVVGDFFRLAPYLKADLVFLSPPWGGPSYNQTPMYTLDMLMPKDGFAAVAMKACTFQVKQNRRIDLVLFGISGVWMRKKVHNIPSCSENSSKYHHVLATECVHKPSRGTLLVVFSALRF